MRFVWRISLATGATSQVVNAYNATGLAVGPDGVLYAAIGSEIYRLDPTLNTWVAFAAVPDVTPSGGGSVTGVALAMTADATHLWVTVGYHSWYSNAPIGIDSVSLADGTVAAVVTDPSIGATQIVSAGDYLYDSSNGTILRRWSKATGAALNVAGSGGSASTDGTATDAWFNNITAVASDGTNVWVLDANQLRKVVTGTPLPAALSPLATESVAVSSGTVSTFAGSGAASTSAGIGTDASFAAPSSMVVVGGVGYVADNDAISKVDLTSGVVSIFAGYPGPMSVSVAAPTGSAAYVGNAQYLTTDGYYLYVDACGSVWRISLATGATSQVVNAYNATGLAVGPDGVLYAAIGSEIYRLDPTLNTWVAFAAVPDVTPSGGGSVTGVALAMTADATHLWITVGYHS